MTGMPSWTASLRPLRSSISNWSAWSSLANSMASASPASTIWAYYVVLSGSRDVHWGSFRRCGTPAVGSMSVSVHKAEKRSPGD